LNTGDQQHGNTVLRGIGTLLVILLRLMAVFVGLILIAGGGLLSFCGVLSHTSSDMFLAWLGLIPVAIGGFVIYLAFSRKSRARAAAKHTEAPTQADDAP